MKGQAVQAATATANTVMPNAFMEYPPKPQIEMAWDGCFLSLSLSLSTFWTYLSPAPKVPTVLPTLVFSWGAAIFVAM